MKTIGVVLVSLSIVLITTITTLAYQPNSLNRRRTFLGFYQNDLETTTTTTTTTEIVFNEKKSYSFGLNKLLFKKNNNSNNKRNAVTANQKTKKKKKPRKTKKNKILISNVHELREAVLDRNVSLSDTKCIAEFSNYTASELLNHEVVQLMARRFAEKTTPQNRTDNATLAIAIEGGGMRGAIGAGMAAALVSLGLLDTVDVIYGSSAGSIIGAYMVSRQVAVDVLTKVLPDAKKDFVCMKRIRLSVLSEFATSKSRLPLPWYKKPGMNLSYVLDSVMSESGERPLDMERFLHNDQHLQKLRVVTSCIDKDDNNTFRVKCYGTEDFTDQTVSSTGRSGLMATLEASMSVPGATGGPVQITRKSSNNNADSSATTSSSSPQSLNLKSFDAFCFEPIPYRSAVEEGATHVLAFRSQPQDFIPPTKQTGYETQIAFNYFLKHKEKEVAKYFKDGKQQYVYLEDYLTLEEGLRSIDQKIKIPPSCFWNNEEKTKQHHEKKKDQSTWKEAHVLPVVNPHGTPELDVLELNSTLITQATRSGYATAFDLLAPAIGLSLDSSNGDSFDSKQIAELIFPLQDEEDSQQQQQKKKKRYGLKNLLWKSSSKKKIKVLGTTIDGKYNDDEQETTTSQQEWADYPVDDNAVTLNTNFDEETLELVERIPAFGSFPSLYSCITKLTTQHHHQQIIK